MIILIPLLVLVIGALVYLLAPNAKYCEMGRIAYGAGLLVLVYHLSGQTLSFLR